MNTLISAEGLWKYFGAQTALAGVSFSILPGELVLFTGPNGAGKSTCLSLIAGVLAPDKGRVQVAGFDLASAGEFQQLRRVLPLSYLPATSLLYAQLTIEENLELAAALYGLPVGGAVVRMLEVFKIKDAAQKTPRQCSQGVVRRAALARAFVVQPRLLLLDEPLTNLDQESAGLFRRALQEALAQGATAVIASHQVVEVAAGRYREISFIAGQVGRDERVSPSPDS